MDWVSQSLPSCRYSHGPGLITEAALLLVQSWAWSHRTYTPAGSHHGARPPAEVFTDWVSQSLYSGRYSQGLGFIVCKYSNGLGITQPLLQQVQSYSWTGRHIACPFACVLGNGAHRACLTACIVILMDLASSTLPSCRYSHGLGLKEPALLQGVVMDWYSQSLPFCRCTRDCSSQSLPSSTYSHTHDLGLIELERLQKQSLLKTTRNGKPN